MNAENLQLIERKEPEFIKFESAGEVVDGELVRVDAIDVGERKQRVNRYTLEVDDKGTRVSFLGAYQIDSKLTPRDIGHWVEITCLGEDPNVSRNGNAMKLFCVRVSAHPVKRVTEPNGRKLEDGTYITNSDIPF